MARDAEVVLINKLNNIGAQLSRVLTVEATRLQKRIQNKFLSGSKTTSRSVAERTGRLKKSVVVVSSRVTGSTITSEVRIRERTRRD